MDKIVSLIEGFSGDNTEILKQLQTELKKSQETLIKGLPHIDTALTQLEPGRHSLGYLHLLAVKAITNFDPEIFILQVAKFLNLCIAKQIRMDPTKFRLVCFKFTEVCRETKQPIRAIKPLKNAIWKIGPGDQITPQHAMFLQSCILAKCYKAALPVLVRFVFEIEPEKTGIESIDTRLYFYYGGICYIGLKQFNKALEFFEIVISAPALMISAIMVEAYKKYVLVSLIQRGEVGTLPRYTNSSLNRMFKQICPGYEELITSFSTKSIQDLHKVVENHGVHFLKDGNMGLVKQAIQSLYKQNIQRLTKTYITLSMKDITEQSGLGDPVETERRVFKMIQNGEVFATINQKEGMVEFHDDPEQYNDNKTLEDLDKHIQLAINLTKKVREIDENISLSQRYIQKTLQAERGPGGRWPGGDEEEMGMAIEKPGLHGPGGFRG